MMPQLVSYSHPGMLVGYSRDYDVGCDGNVGCLPCMIAGDTLGVVGIGILTAKTITKSNNKGDTLIEGQNLHKGDALVSRNRQFWLVMQDDGNVTLYNVDPRARDHDIWSTGTYKEHPGNCTGEYCGLRRGQFMVFKHLSSGQNRACWTTQNAPSKANILVIQDDGNLVIYQGTRPNPQGHGAVWSSRTYGGHRPPSPGGFFSSLGHAFSSIAKDVEHGIESVEKVATHIPILGSVVKLSATPFDMVSHLVKGERIDHALLGELKTNIAAVKEVAPYVTTVVSFVPGIGTGVAAAIAAGTSLVEGKNITDALIEGFKGALPGGELAAHGLSLATKIAKGENVGKAAFEEARSTLPPIAQHGFDIGLALATGKSMQHALISTALDLTHATTILDTASHSLNLAEKLGAQRIIKTTIKAAREGNAIAHEALRTFHTAKQTLAAKDSLVAQNLIKAAEAGIPEAKKLIAATVVTARKNPHAREALAHLVKAKTMAKKAPHARDPKAHVAAVKSGASTDGVLIVRTGNKYRLARGKFAHHPKGSLSGVLITRTGHTIHSTPGTFNKG
jgi:hypothetical protein